MNAERVLPRAAQFLYRDYPSYAGFSNFFRYRLLLEGAAGVSISTPFACVHLNLSPTMSSPAKMFWKAARKRIVGATKVPAGCDLMADLWRQCEAFDIGKLAWGECGPKLMAEAIHRHGFDQLVQPPRAFCPLPWWEWRNVLDRDGRRATRPRTPTQFTFGTRCGVEGVSISSHNPLRAACMRDYRTASLRQEN